MGKNSNGLAMLPTLSVDGLQNEPVGTAPGSPETAGISSVGRKLTFASIVAQTLASEPAKLHALVESVRTTNGSVSVAARDVVRSTRRVGGLGSLTDLLAKTPAI